MRHLSKNIPYRNTTISAGLTKTHIMEMLKEAGAEAARWTEDLKGTELPILEFILRTEWQGVEKQFGVRIQPKIIYDQKRRYGTRGGLIKTPNENASMRLLYWYLKARLEAVRFGLDDVFTTFMSRVINSLPDGRDVTLGETVREHPEVLRDILPTFEIKALEQKQ